MRSLRLAAVAVASLILCSCGGSSPNPSAPSEPAPSLGVTPQPALPCPVIGFDDLQTRGGAFSTYTACGFTVTPTTSNWTVSTTYGRPAPFIQFMATAGTTTAGEIMVTAGGAKFTFQSVDVYSSTTPIPYVITGIAVPTTVFSIQKTQGNTFGNFATVVNPQPATPIDVLLIRLTNPAAPCCSNPMGLDNIRVQQR